MEAYMNIVDLSSRDMVLHIINNTCELLNTLNVSKDNPKVDVKKLATDLELTIKESQDLQQDHARLENNTIFLRSEDTEEQKRFSIAHEIAHVRVGEGIVVKVNGQYVTVRFEKKVARKMNHTKVMNETHDRSDVNLVEEALDYYAASLLLPSHIFSLFLDRENEEIAKLFAVPVKCVEKRREEIKSELERLDDVTELIPDCTEPLSEEDTLKLLGL